MFTFKLNLFSCFTSGSECVHVWMLFFFLPTFITMVADACMLAYLYICAWILIRDAVLSEDIAVHVPTPGGGGGG